MNGPWKTTGDGVWEPFEVVPGMTVGEIHVLRGSDDYTNGFWRYAGEPPEPFPYEMAQNETVYVIEGEVSISMEGGPTLDLVPGALASFAAGTKTTWRLTKTPFREVFVLS